jgi:hypothetical protein
MLIVLVLLPTRSSVCVAACVYYTEFSYGRVIVRAKRNAAAPNVILVFVQPADCQFARVVLERAASALAR